MYRPIGRRAILRGIGAGLTTAAVGRAVAAAEPPGFASPLLFHSPPLRKFVDELPRLPIIGGDRLDLVAATTEHRFHRDLPPAPAFGYNDRSYLGPTIEHVAGTPLAVRFHNRIGAHPFAADIDTSLHGVPGSYRTTVPASLHLHGGVTPPASDGHPEQLMLPGQQLDHDFPFRQSAGHLWYHDHAMGITRANVYAGLAGMVLLRDEFDTGRPDNPLGLPADEFELPLVLQEKIFTPEGRQSLRSTAVVPQGLWEGGGVGDVGVVNGVAWPELPVARGLYRFRVINAASFSVWNLFFGNRMRFWVIGTEHGLLDAPVEVRNLRLAPAERVDLLVDFADLAPGETVELRNDEQPVFRAAVLGEIAMPVFCRFRVQDRAGFRGAVPHTLRGGPRQPSLLPTVREPALGRDLTVSQPYELRMPPAIMSLNNLRYSELGFDPDASFPRTNPAPAMASHSDAHTAHHDSDLRGYIWHCHLLDHEDHDMMLRFRTVR